MCGAATDVRFGPKADIRELDFQANPIPQAQLVIKKFHN
jgi:hypothetical protein